MSEPKPIKHVMSKGQFFVVLTVVMIAGMSVFFLIRESKPPPLTSCQIAQQREERATLTLVGPKKFAEMKRKGWTAGYCPEAEEEDSSWWPFGQSKYETSKEEKEKVRAEEERQRQELREKVPGYIVCEGWKDGYGTEYIQEAVLQDCLYIVPREAIEGLDKSFLWSVKRKGLMVSHLALGQDLPKFKKQIEALSLADVTKPFIRGVSETTLFTEITFEMRNLITKYPPADIPLNVWVGYIDRNGKNALENVLAFPLYWKEVFHHKHWKNHVEDLEALADKARIAFFPINKEINAYLDAQIKLAREA